MTYLQNTGICWYANKITEVSFFILHHKKGDPSKRPLSGSKQKLILKLLTYILRQLGFILCIWFFFLFFSSMGKYFESKTEVRRLKNKTIITICHLRYLEECSVTNKIHLYIELLWEAHGTTGEGSFRWSKTMSHVFNSTKIVLTIIDKLSSCWR